MAKVTVKRVKKSDIKHSVSIDTKELAKSIVEAQEKAEKEREKANRKMREENKKRKLSNADVRKGIVAIIRNKVGTDGTLTAGLLGQLMSCFFNFLALCCLFLSFSLIVGGILSLFMETFLSLKISAKIQLISNIFLTICFSSFFSLIFRGVANEIGRETDRNYIVAIFSGVVSFTALIIAVLTFFKE